jgi:hypothetical protein
MTQIRQDIQDAAAVCTRAAERLRALLDVEDIEEAVRDDPPPPEMALYSQRNPMWRYQPYAGGVSFGRAGCYTVAVAMIVSLAGYDDTPPAVARKMREAGCYSGAYLTRPDRIPDAYPELRYDGPVDVSTDGPLRWHHSEADMARFREELERGPVITEVDFRPGGAFNQHFVVCEHFTENGDVVIADPWDGTRRELLDRYSPTWGHWDLGRGIYGVRLLRVR